MFNTSRWYIRLGNLAFNLFLLNLLWILFSFLGLLIFGLFPATAALFAVLRQLIMEGDDLPVLKLFISKIKSEFIKSNIIGYLIVIAGLVLYIDLRVLQQIDNNNLYIILTSITLVVGIVYLFTVLYIFPVFVHFNLKIWQYPKHAIIVAIGRPLQTIMMIGGLAVLIYFYIQFPVLVPTFGMSLIGFLLMKISLVSFPKKTH